MEASGVTQERIKVPYRKRIRFSGPSILINERDFPNLRPYLSWVDGTNMEEKTKYVRWGFCFTAPLRKSANSWRWAWIKLFGKLWVIRWTLPRIYWG